MHFGLVVSGLKAGRRYEREGWNGKGMFIFLVPGSTFKVNREPLLSILGEGKEVEYHAHIDMKTAQGYVVPWLASQADVLAEDWQEVHTMADVFPAPSAGGVPTRIIDTTDQAKPIDTKRPIYKSAIALNKWAYADAGTDKEPALLTDAEIEAYTLVGKIS